MSEPAALDDDLRRHLEHLQVERRLALRFAMAGNVQADTVLALSETGTAGAPIQPDFPRRYGEAYRLPLPSSSLGKPLKIIGQPVRERIPIFLASLTERAVR